MAKKAVVIDTNVALVANNDPEKSSFVPPDCIENCIEAIRKIRKEGIIAIDYDYEILGEYRNKLCSKRQMGEGDKFLKWLYEAILKDEQVIYRKITPFNGSYKEFPDHPALKNFDRSDKKFVAVANADVNNKLKILQATDSKWWGWRKGLKAVGVPIDFLCKSYIKKKHEEKIE